MTKLLLSKVLAANSAKCRGHSAAFGFHNKTNKLLSKDYPNLSNNLLPLFQYIIVSHLDDFVKRIFIEAEII